MQQACLSRLYQYKKASWIPICFTMATLLHMLDKHEQ